MRGGRPTESEDLRELSIRLAAWMIALGGKAATLERAHAMAETALSNGSALRIFLDMVTAQGGNVSVFDDLQGFHKPGATQVVEAWESGYVAEMDTTTLGWAVQRLGAGREKAGEPVDPYAGIIFHARRGAKVQQGEPLATLFATRPEMLAEPIELLRKAIVFSDTAPETVPLVSCIFTREKAEEYLRDAVR
jgi:pyrimidine-nucleoside phosphorylase